MNLPAGSIRMGAVERNYPFRL